MNPASDTLPGRGHEQENRLGPALAWAAGGGAAVLGFGLLLYILALSVGQWLAGTPQQAMASLASAPLYREFGGLFLTGFLAIFVGREFGLRTR
jgi:hypothetical protein